MPPRPVAWGFEWMIQYHAFDSSHYASTPMRKLRRSLQLAPQYYLRDLPRYLRCRYLLGLPLADLAVLLNPVGELLPSIKPHLGHAPRFEEALGHLADTGVVITMPPYRLQALAGAWWSARTVPGDAIECGAYRGATSLFLALLGVLNEVHQVVYPLDTFSGMPPPSQLDFGREIGEFSPPDDQIQIIYDQAANLGVEDRIRVESGRFSESFERLRDRGDALKFAFAHIDCNLYESTRQACEFVYDRISPGGIIVFDDYNGVCDLGARLAIDQFLRDVGSKIRRLCGSSAYIVRTR